MILGKLRRGTVGAVRPGAGPSKKFHKLRSRFVKFGTTRKFKCPYGTMTKLSSDAAGRYHCKKVCRPKPTNGAATPGPACPPGQKFNYDTDKCKCE